MTATETLRVTILRNDPSQDARSQLLEYRVPREPGMVVADVLQYVYEHEAPDLAFLWECRTRRCGTCAVRVDGRPVLTCAEPASDGMTLAPLDGLPVIRDLIVDRLELQPRLAPWTDGRDTTRDLRVLDTPRDIGEYRALSECIDCFICDSVCPALRENAEGGLQFGGPRRLIRTEAQVQRRGEPQPWLLAAAQANPSLCTRCFACTEACPRDLRPMEAIGALTSRLFQHGLLDQHKTAHVNTFARSIRWNGWLDEFRLLVDVYGPLGVLRFIPQALLMLRRGKLPKPHVRRAPQSAEIQQMLKNLDGGELSPSYFAVSTHAQRVAGSASITRTPGPESPAADRH